MLKSFERAGVALLLGAMTACGGDSSSSPSSPSLSISTSSLPGGSAGTAYNQTLAAANGTAPYAWSILTGALPPGLTLDAASGAISGTPTVNGVSNFTARVTDAANRVANRALSITVTGGAAAPPVVTTATLPDAAQGVPYDQGLSASNGAPPYTWSVTAGALPTGLSLNSSTGRITGTPTVLATFNFTVQAADSTTPVPQTDTQALSIVVNPPVSISSSTLPEGTEGAAYVQTLVAIDGSAPYSWALASGALPAGLSLSAAGTINGTATAAGSYAFTARVTDANGGTDTQALTILINSPVTITTVGLPTWTQSVAYNQTLAATGGTAPLTWSVSAGTLPAGFGLNASTGQINGTPVGTGTSNFTVTVTDNAGATDPQNLSITINAALAVTTATLPDWTRDRAYSQSVGASGGTAPLAWSVSAGALPVGLALASATGAITGTPTVAGNSTFTIQVSDSIGALASQAYTVAINVPPAITTASLPQATQGQAYSQFVAVSNGTAPFGWSTISGALPAGLTLDTATGEISGTPTGTGTSTFTLQVLDVAGASATQGLSITVNNAPNITSTTAPNWTVGRPYNHTLSVTGGTAPLSWAQTGGTLPTGVTLSSTGTLSGTPTTPGNFSFTAQVTDADLATDSQVITFTINLNPVISTLSLPAWTVNRAYSQNLSASNGTPSYTWSLFSGTLPSGLSLSSAGAITGTPDTVGNASFTVQVTDAAAATDTQALSIVINAAPAVTTASLPTWTQGHPYNQGLSATDGTLPYAWSLFSGTPPAGLSVTSGGAVSGTPTGTGTSNFTVQVADAAGAADTQALSLTINAAVSVTTVSLPNGTQGTAYSQTVTGAGGTGALTWSIPSGSLSAGLVLNASTGEISGTPTGFGTSNFTVRATDTVGASASKALSIAISPSALSVATTVLPDGTSGSYYEASLSGAGGALPYSWSVTGGALPAGLALSGAGVLSGTPSATGPFSFTLTVTDAALQTAGQAYAITINGAAPSLGGMIVTTTRLPDATAGVAYSQSVWVVGGVGPYTWSLDTAGNAAPSGLALGAGGILSGTPAAGSAGNYTLTVRVTDNGSNRAEAHVFLVVHEVPAPTLAITPLVLPGGTVGIDYPLTTFTATGGQPPYVWEIAEDSGPPIGMLLTREGLLYGRPIFHASGNMRVRVRDSASPFNEAVGTFPITVAPGAGFTVTTTSLPDATVGVPYSQPVLTNGIDGPPTRWIFEDSRLRKLGLSVDPATGAVSGTPIASGDAGFIIGATNSGVPRVMGGSLVAFQVATPAFGIVSRTLPDGRRGMPYTQTLQAQGAINPTWAVEPVPDNQLPQGLALDPATGVISGTIANYVSSDDYLVLIRIDEGASTALGLIVINTLEDDIEILNTGGGSSDKYLATATAGSPYSGIFNTTFDMDTAEASALAGESLPAGLALDPLRRKLSGTPAVPGRYMLDFRIDNPRVEGSSMEPVQHAEDRLVFEILQAPGFRISERVLPSGRAGAAYLATILTEGAPGATPYAFSVTSGSLPPGLTLDAVNGTISGTPTAAGVYSFTLQAAQGASTATMAYDLPIDSEISFGVATRRLPDAMIGMSYRGQLHAHGATGAVAWSDASSVVTFASLGLTLANSGLVTGVPSAAAGMYTVVVTATDGPASSIAEVRVLVAATPIAFNTIPTLGTVSLPYAGALVPVGGSPPYAVALAPGESLPYGLMVDASGNISGPPLVAGGFEGTLYRITDSTGRTGYGVSQQLMFSADLPTLGFNIWFDDAANGRVGQVFSRNYAAQGGTLDYVFSTSPTPPSAATDLLPASLALSTVGPSPSVALITGTPVVAGRYSYTMRVTDANGTGATADRATGFRIDIDYFDMGVITRRVPLGSASTVYPDTPLRYLKNSNPANPISWSATGLPAGMSLNASTGVLSASSLVPAGTYFFVATITDTVTSATASTRIKLVIAP